MIHLCVVWRKGKWVVTSSDTVPSEERAHTALQVCRQRIAEARWKDWKDSEIIEYLNEGMKEVVKCSKSF